VFIVLWFVPSVSQAFFDVVRQVTGAFGIDVGLIGLGQDQMPRLR